MKNFNLKNWQLKRLTIDTSIIIIASVAVVLIFGFPEFSAQLNLLSLLATLAVLIWYAYDTHRIANQTVEGNLRPLILRSGFIESWEKVKFSVENGLIEGKLLEFSILKNIAKDISGFIIINKKKHQLLFGNIISSKNIRDGLSDAEKSVLFYLYEQYKTERRNLPKKPTEVFKNIGIDSGQYVGTINDSKYLKFSGDDLMLSNEGIRLMDSDKPIECKFEQNWGWMNLGTKINAVFRSDKYEKVEEQNKIYLTYSDMEGNKYFTEENKNFSQNSGKL